MDVKSAFLNGDLKEEVYVHQPPGFEIPGKEGKVLRLRKALYGLQQAPRAWNAKLDSTLKEMGFEQSPHEAAIYWRGNGGNALLVGVYVDDLVTTGAKNVEVAVFKDEMKATFQMSDLGPLSFYLGSRCTRTAPGSHFDRPPTPSASLTDCNPALTPMEERLKLSHDSTAEEVDATQYRRLVGSLRYLVHTRPDLAFSVGYVNRFMQRPTTKHQQAVKRIICYVAGTLDHGLYYLRCPGEAHLVGYSDSDHGGDIDTSKSTCEILFFVGKCLVSWQSVKQQVVALSSCEAEYITASTASTQALWLARLLGDLLGRDTKAVELRVDSKSALALAKNPIFYEQSKHIRVRYHFIRDCWEEGSIKARYINTKDQLADLLTKPLGRIKFLELRSRTGMPAINMYPQPLRLVWHCVRNKPENRLNSKCHPLSMRNSDTNIEEGGGVETVLIYQYRDCKIPEKSFNLVLILRLSESTDITRTATACLQWMASQFELKFVSEAAVGELTLLPSLQYTSRPSDPCRAEIDLESYGDDSRYLRPDPICCKVNGHGPCANAILAEEVIHFFFWCSVSAIDCSLPHKADKPSVVRGDRRAPLNLTIGCLAHHVYGNKEQPLQESYALEIIGDDEERGDFVSIQQCGESLKAKAASFFLFQPDLTEYRMLRISRHGVAGFFMQKPSGKRDARTKTSGRLSSRMAVACHRSMSLQRRSHKREGTDDLGRGHSHTELGAKRGAQWASGCGMRVKS
ncbi:LOW QUALITY PROTEIN: hypothetical protein U9M48_030994 [Paspalum notatum var. saurae]|uniref:Reverse transcriptase Ty1/copia-type domain-containing protein n=1 Tax=Paspalum notatum var. saurae TaxID=547442 RepID=A0AAQ3U2S2_PASNO